MINFKTFRKPQLLEAIFLIVIVLAILGGMMIFVQNITPHIPIIITISFLLLYGLYKKLAMKICKIV